METASNKIKYGLSNVTIFPITSTAETGTPTYSTTPIKIPGSVEMKMDANGEITEFKADNVTYYISASNNGYSGSLTNAKYPTEFKVQCLGQQEDTNGMLIESTTDKPSEFGMVYQFEGDQAATRIVLYRCLATKPGLNHKTKSDTIEPDTEELSINAMGRLDNGFVKATIEAGTANYDTALTTMPEPTFTSGL